MTETELKVFLDVTRAFFEKLGPAPVSSGPGHIAFEAPALSDFTGLMEFAGGASGYACITMPRATLTGLLAAVGERAVGDVAFADMIGEVANIVCANARQALGEAVKVSNPTPIMGADNGPALPTPVFVWPLSWDSHPATLLLALERA